MRLATQKVLVHNMKCIETLARVDVLCVDKTGTITDNTMSVKKVIPFRSEEMPEAEEMPEEEEEEDTPRLVRNSVLFLCITQRIH